MEVLLMELELCYTVVTAKGGYGKCTETQKAEN